MISTIVLVYIILSLWSRLNLLLPSRIVFYLRASHFILVLGLVCLCGIPLCYVLSRTSYRFDALHFASKTFYSVLSYVLGVHVQLEGFKLKNYQGQAIYVVNHQSSLDTFLLGKVIPRKCLVLAKKSLETAPFLGQMLKVAHTFFVDRENHDSAMKTMKESCEKLIQHKLSLIVFPEGTRSRRKDKTLLPFKKGAFYLAIQAQIPVIPIVFASYEDIYDSNSKSFNTGEIRAKILEPIPTIDMSKDNIDVLIQKTKSRMEQALKDISVPTPKLT